MEPPLVKLGDSVSLKDRIMIHVIDDNKSQKKDFQFSRSLLVRYMKYFDKCLKKISENDEIDISIHCDASIFEWLLSYILAYEESIKPWHLKGRSDDKVLPSLDLKNVVSILISSDFLKIDLLVNQCIAFFVNSIEEMSKLQVDMSCINSNIIREIAR